MRFYALPLLTTLWLTVVFCVPTATAAPQKKSANKGSYSTVSRKTVKSKRTKKRSTSRKKRRRSRDRWPPMSLVQANSHEKLTVRLYDRKGRTNKKGVRQLYKFLRCLKSGKMRTMNWRLLKHLYTVSRKYKGKTLLVYSGYRSRKLPPGRESRHKTGRAVDFRVSGVSKATLRDYLMKRFKKVGVGYYPYVPFVHLDVRKKRSAFWVDVSRSGQRSQYVKNPREWVRLQAKKVTLRKAPVPSPAAAKVVQGPPPLGPDAMALNPGE